MLAGNYRNHVEKKRDFILFIVTLKKYLDGQQMGVFTNAF